MSKKLALASTVIFCCIVVGSYTFVSFNRYHQSRALMVAVDANNRIDNINALQSNADPNFKCAETRDAVTLSTVFRHVGNGMGINVGNDRPEMFTTPLLSCFVSSNFSNPEPTRDHGQLALTLLKAGADPSLAGYENEFFPLQCAAMVKDKLVVSALIAHSAYVNQTNRYGYTALFAAIFSGQKI